MPDPRPKCSTQGCRKKAAKGYAKCHCCRQRGHRERHPIKAQWARLKASAKKRGINFELPLDWFTELCERTRYHEKAGLMPGDLSIDRARNLEGYTIDNVRIITRTENTAKGNIERIPNVHIRRHLLQRLADQMKGGTVDHGKPDADAEQWW